jgi:hypothetical protein
MPLNILMQINYCAVIVMMNIVFILWNISVKTEVISKQQLECALILIEEANVYPVRKTIAASSHGGSL